MLWALAQPAAMVGLVAAFVIGVGLRSAAQWFVARRLGLPVAGAPITSLDPSSSGARNYRQLAREVIAAHAPALG